MKRFDELTDAEVLVLTDEQIAYHVDYECADQGKGLLPPDPGPAPVKPQDMKDMTAYKVGEFIFATQEDALAVCEAVNNASRYEATYVSGPSYEQFLKRSDTEAQVNPARYYSANGWDAAKALVLKYGTDKKAWDAAVAAYSKIADERAKCAEWIHERISQVRDHEWQRQQIVAELARYIELANGDESIARRFLLKARPDANDYLPPVAPEVSAAS